jgi:ABC-type polysaccharide/polyol phosphate transport system ATPase subunit
VRSSREPVVEVHHLYRDFSVSGGRRSLLRVLRDSLHRDGTSRQRRRALDDVSITARRGDKIAIVGNNGAGKSTLLRIIAGLLRATRGSVAVQGDMVFLTSLGLGMIEDVTVLDNTYLYGALYGVAPARMRLVLDDILTWAEITGYEQTKLKALSTGTRARLAFSVVRHLAADVFLVDEAMSAGDVAFAAKCRAFFEEPLNRERTFLVATHDLSLAQSFCPTALWLHEGRLMAFGDSRTVVGQYLEAQAPAGAPGTKA